MKRIDFAMRRARRERVREDLRRLVAGLPKPYRRERPRDPDEARLLRERGTPERLIGPTREPGEDD